ncbi:MAG: SgcJ/EcaC family oxidoreductase [Bacillota bacterium]
MSNLLAAARSVVDAVNRHDSESVASHYAPSAVQVMSSGDRAEGRAAIAAYFTAMFTAFPDLKMEIKRVTVTGPDKAVAEYVMSGTHLGPLVQNGQTIAPTGRAFKASLANVVTLNEAGAITSATTIGDSTAIARGLGLLPSRVTAEQRVALVRKLFQAVSGGDLEGIMACYAPLAHYGDEMSKLDRNDIRELWALRLKGYPSIKVHEKEIATDGPTVVAGIVLEAVQSGQLPDGTTTGQTVHLEMLELFEIGPAGIYAHRSYSDPASALRQLGLMPR